MPTASGRICTRCVLPESFPGISFDAAGVCSVCAASGTAIARTEEKHKLKLSLEETIEKHRGSLMKKLQVRSVPELVRLALLVDKPCGA